jgi:hypothetical protein
MEDQHGWGPKDYSIMLIYHPFRDYETKEFHVALELRDYSKRYLAMVQLGEEMFLDLLKQYTELKKAGFTYRAETTFKKGKDDR